MNELHEIIQFDNNYGCKVCEWTGGDNEMLKAPSPFDAEDILRACPECKQCTEGFDHLCNIPGCKEIGGCGFPTKTHGYMWTCYKHYAEYKNT